MTLTIDLPLTGSASTLYTLAAPRDFIVSGKPFRSRIAFAAAHVVADPSADQRDKQRPPKLDWDATLAYRRHLWSLGFAVAEAMDTAQRGMGLDWVTSQELIRRSVAEAHSVMGVVACGAGTDQLVPGPNVRLDDVMAAYEEQCQFVEAHGGRIILMASRALAACAKSADDYARVYDHILSQVHRPVIIHWLGEMFDPALAGYWGSRNVDEAMRTCLGILRTNNAKIEGIKISLLDAEREISMRRLLPHGVRMYTGDDFNYPRLIRGDEHGHSHALLGILDAIAPAAAAALHALDQGDMATYEAILEPTVALSRHIFQTPTYHYKTGIVFLAWLNGHQSHFKMVGGQETARSVAHLAQLFVLADKAGLLRDPELAVKRMKEYLAGG
jgi:uncharacterized protein DUF993